MADMLSNTVGVVVFILIFTVLTTGGVSVPKRLPMEQESSLRPVELVCWKGRVLAVEEEALRAEFLAPLGKRTFDGADQWVQRFRERRIEKPNFVVTGEGDTHYSGDFFARTVSFELILVVTPRDSAGESPAQFVAPNSRLRALLGSHDRAKDMIYFLVTPGGIPAFGAARDIATGAGFGTGWAPFEENQPIRICIAGCGGGGIFPTKQ